MNDFSALLRKYDPHRDDHGRFAVSSAIAHAESKKETEGSSPMIHDALKFITEKHKGQFRKVSGLPYVSHPIAVSAIVSAYKKSKHLDELVTASLLHDTLEDTDTNFHELATRFTPLVASLVLELSNNEEEMAKVGKLEYQKKKMEGMSSYGLTIKLADRLHNVSDNPTKKMLSDTQELLTHVEGKRRLSPTQSMLVKHIRDICTDGLK